MIKTERKNVNSKLLPGFQRELGKFIRFGAVGASSTLLDFAVLSALKYFLSWPTLPANLLSSFCGMLNSYILCTRWVYSGAKRQKNFVQLFRFFLINLAGLVLSNLIIGALEQPLGILQNQPEMGYLPAKLVASLVVFFWNFFANRFWTFGKDKLPRGPDRREYQEAQLELKPAPF